MPQRRSNSARTGSRPTSVLNGEARQLQHRRTEASATLAAADASENFPIQFAGTPRPEWSTCRPALAPRLFPAMPPRSHGLPTGRDPDRAAHARSLATR